MPPSHQWLSISPTPFGISTSSRLHWPSASSQALASLIPGMICWKRPHTSTGNGRSGGNLPASTNPRRPGEQRDGSASVRGSGAAVLLTPRRDRRVWLVVVWAAAGSFICNAVR